MDAVTYPNKLVIRFIENHVVPLRIPSDQKPQVDDYRVTWTPTLLILDSKGLEHHRSVGFLGEDQLIPSLLLGVGNLHFNTNTFNDAIACYDRIITESPDSDAAPEAIFQRGVAQFKSSHNPAPLKEAYELLHTLHKESLWAHRALPYRLIP